MALGHLHVSVPQFQLRVQGRRNTLEKARRGLSGLSIPLPGLPVITILSLPVTKASL